MVLSPLAVILLAQLALVMLGIIIFQTIHKSRIAKERDQLKKSRKHASDHQSSSESEDFDRQQAELLLNRILQNIHTITSEAPAAKALCENQQALLYTLSDCLSIQLDPTKKPQANEPIFSPGPAAPSLQKPPPALHESTDIISQEDIDQALNREKAIESFDMDDFDSLDIGDDADTDDDGLPEDSVQRALDSMDDFDLSDFEEQLNKI